MEDEQYYKLLVQRFADRTATDEELEVFIKLANEGKLDAYLTEAMNQDAGIIAADETNFAAPARIRPLWMRIAAAASIVVILSAGSYFLLRKPTTTPQTAQIQKTDIQPGRNQATLTLANGQKIILTKGLNGKLAQQGNMSINVNSGNAIAYQAMPQNRQESIISYNTLSTARGEQSPYPLVLADGTKIWLNAASSVTFPTAFNGKERVVKITGEAYFEVVHNAAQPFKVQVANQVIEDIGTEFNINAYNDEPVLRTTLISGSAKVSLSQNSIILKPGEQAQNNGTLLKMQHVDTEGITAWKNNYFLFDDNNIEGIMRQVSRWYNVNVVYENEEVKTKMLTGTISRYKSVGSVLRKIELTKAAHFRIEGKQILVTK